ncbi:hypothetical protein ACHAXT_005999 [Thalassiosira profunda]
MMSVAQWALGTSTLALCCLVQKIWFPTEGNGAAWRTKTKQNLPKEARPDDCHNYTSTRRPIFFHHVSKAGGTYTNALARRNREQRATLRWKGSPCRYLTDPRCANVTFLHYEHSLSELTADERRILFDEKRYITFTQVRKPVDLERSWLREIQHGYEKCLHYQTFSEYLLDESKSCRLRRDHSLLSFLGGKLWSDVNVTDAAPKSLQWLDRLDFINIMEDRNRSTDMFRTIFGWDDFALPGKFTKAEKGVGSNVSNRTADEESSWDEHFEHDNAVYRKAKALADNQWMHRHKISDLC